jgi:hypothetical protein
MLPFWRIRYAIFNTPIHPSHRLFPLCCLQFYPTASWVTPFGGKGMFWDRAERVWNTMIHPEATTMQDVREIFFFEEGRRDRLWTMRG